MSKYTAPKEYNGELDNVDPEAFGLTLRVAGKSYTDDENDPTEGFYWATDDHLAFFEKFQKGVSRGWHKEDNRLREIEYKRQLPAFQDNIPEIGVEVFVEHPNNKGEYFACVVEYIPPERDNVVVRYADKKGAYGQSNLSVLGYSYPGAFPVFHRQVPVA